MMCNREVRRVETPDSDELDVEAGRAAYAVGMMLHALRRVRIASVVVGVIAVGAVYFTRSLWWAAGGFVLTVIIQRFLLSSCTRFVESQVGLTPDEQVRYLQRYKLGLLEPSQKELIDKMAKLR